MIKLGDEGYYFTSKSGIKYDLYEGLTMGGPRRYTSDAIFIMLSDERYLEKCDANGWLVDYWMGATFLSENLEEYNNDIEYLVSEYEKKNGIYNPQAE